ncbi:MAG: succinylglutamate desuccinylase/aspartoacylase family protein [Beijerinckiaceae bacterium]
MSGSNVKSRIRCEVDFDRDGRQAVYLRAPLSRNTSGWGAVEIPLVVLKNGRGPTVLFTGGVHGDEYEGPIAISKLIRSLDPQQIQGRVIMMPAVNMPAVLADTRLSPVDGRDINRCFPGNARGTFSEMLAHFMDSVILPHVDISVDLHTAGHSMESALSTNMHYVEDAAIRERTMAIAAAFGAPFNAVFWGVDEGATFTSCVERRGKISIGTELGGWGRVNVEGVRIAERGLLNVLKAAGVMEGLPETRQRDGSPHTRHMMVKDSRNFLFARHAATYEPAHIAGDVVRAGDRAGLLHFVEDFDRDPVAVHYETSGVLWMAPGPGRVQRGDCIGVVMQDYDAAIAAA